MMAARTSASDSTISTSRSNTQRRGTILRQSSVATVAAVIAVGTGVVFDMSVAFVFGPSRASDAFFVASRIPVGLMAVFMTAANQALVPLFSKWYTAQGRDATNRRISHLVNCVLFFGLLGALMMWLLAWPLMRVTAPGFKASEVELAASLARILAFTLPFAAASEVLRSLLSARYAFAISSGINTVRNISGAAIIFLGAVVMVGHDSLAAGTGGSARALAGSAQVIAWASAIGIYLQFGVLLVAAWRKGFRPTWGLGLRLASTKRAAKLCARPTAGATLNPCARLVEQLFASFLPVGSITLINLAYRLISGLGGSVFFRSVIMALMPRLTKATTRGANAARNRLVLLGLRVMVVVSLPLTVLVAVLALPGTIAIYGWGKFTPQDAHLLGLVLMVYAASLFGSGLERALLAPFFASLDTRTPLRNTIYGNLANVALLPVIFLLPKTGHYQILVVPAAYGLAQMVHCGHAWYRLNRDYHVSLRPLRRLFIQTVAGSVLLGAVLVFLVQLFGLYETQSQIDEVINTAAVSAIGVALLALFFLPIVRSEWRALKADREAPSVSLDASDPAGGGQQPGATLASVPLEPERSRAADHERVGASSA